MAIGLKTEDKETGLLQLKTGKNPEILICLAVGEGEFRREPEPTRKELHSKISFLPISKMFFVTKEKYTMKNIYLQEQERKILADTSISLAKTHGLQGKLKLGNSSL